MERARHWQQVYASRAPTAVSWFQDPPQTSLDLIAATGIARDAAIIDVGGGASTLVDHLLRAGFADLTVLDIAGEALAHPRARLGDKEARVEWIEADVLQWTPRRRYELWHDRAAFHFLTEAAERRSYVGVLRGAAAAAGHVILATFAPDGPERCSGLPVHRHSAETVAAELGFDFALVETRPETHRTPGGTEQRFLYFRLRRR